jgi:hypothetical protein
MLALTDSQMHAVMDVAKTLPVEKRDLFLQRLGAMLELRGHRYADRHLQELAQLAACGLVHRAADVAEIVSRGHLRAL